MKNFKIYAIVFVSVLIILSPGHISRSCSISFEFSDTDTRFFFDPSIVHEPEFEPLYALGSPANSRERWDSASRRDNINEWRSFFGGIPTSSDIEHIIYEVPESDTRRIKDFVTKDSIILPTELTTNSLVKYLRFTRESDFLDYLVFAKKC